MISIPRDVVDDIMLCVVLIFYSVSSCFCDIDFNERLRNFTVEFFYQTQLETNGHMVCSPFGIWTLMAGVALGTTGFSYNQLARAFVLPENSNTLIQGYKHLTNVLQSPMPSDGVILTSKNFVFLNNDFTIYNQYKNLLQNEFSTSIKVLDFNDPNAARIANTYIERSGGKHSNVLRSDNFQGSKMILVSVSYLKGLWSSPFNTSNTLLEPFYNEQKDVIGIVNMMHQKGQFSFSNIQALESFALELPYGTNKRYSLVIILPYSSRKIVDVHREFVSYALKDIVDQLERDEVQYGPKDVEVKLPRFQISTNLKLNNPLNKMGVYDIFQPDLDSFEKMSKDNLFVSAVFHKAGLEVTESVSVPSPTMSANGISAVSFHCNRPFVYFVMEKSTGIDIISGIYSNPTAY